MVLKILGLSHLPFGAHVIVKRVIEMSENLTQTGLKQPKQFGKDIVQQGEPYTQATLDTIRALLAESNPVPQPKPLSPNNPFAARPQYTGAGYEPPARGTPEPLAETPTQRVGTERREMDAPTQDTATEPELPPMKRSWRKIEVVEGRTGRNLRRIVTSPRMISFMFLCSVVIWQPWFIPMLILSVISAVLLIGALIGQDRMARIVLYFLKRFVWANPSAGQFLQRVLPQRWHGILNRPVTEEDAWDGLIDPSFEARLARIRS